MTVGAAIWRKSWRRNMRPAQPARPRNRQAKERVTPRLAGASTGVTRAVFNGDGADDRLVDVGGRDLVDWRVGKHRDDSGVAVALGSARVPHGDAGIYAGVFVVGCGAGERLRLVVGERIYGAGSDWW